MRTRSFALAAIAALLFNVAVFAAGDTKKARAKKRATMRLVAMLPASDGVGVFDAKRFINDALPTLLSANEPVLGEITAKINEMANRTGVDLRKFDQVIVGVAGKQISAKEVDFDPVAIASGDVSEGALAAIKKLAATGTYHEENIAGHTVYVFTAKDVIQNTSATTPNSKVTAVIDKALKGLSREIAVTAFDRNTLVLGSLARVRQTLEGTTHIGADLSNLLSVKETAVASFAFKPVGGLSKMLPLDIDSLGTSIESIQYLSGSLDITATGTTLQVIARTKLTHQALQLKDTLDVLQTMGGAVLGGSKKPGQAIYGRILKSAKFNVRGSDVMLDVTVPQSDIDALVAGIK